MRPIEREFANMTLCSSVEAFLCVIENKKMQIGFISKINHLTNTKGFIYVQGDKHPLKLDISDNIFDRISYHIFDMGFQYVSDRKKRERVTKIVGKTIFEHYKQQRPINHGSINNLKVVQSDLNDLINYLISVGYLADGKITFESHNKYLWKQEGKAEFLYEMVDPAILPSALELIQKYDVAQHYSDRTIEALLSSHKIKGNMRFDSNKFSSKCVQIRWSIKRV